MLAQLTKPPPQRSPPWCGPPERECCPPHTHTSHLPLPVYLQVLAPSFATSLICRELKVSLKVDHLQHLKLDVDSAHEHKHGDAGGAGTSAGGAEPLAPCSAPDSDGEVGALLQEFHTDRRYNNNTPPAWVLQEVPLRDAAVQLVGGMRRWFERAGVQGEA